MKRAVRGAASLAALAVLVVGPPLMLATVVGWPLPTSVPSVSQVTLSLRSADIPDAVVIKGLACLLWLAWAEIILGVVWEAAINVPRVERGQQPRRSPLVNRHMAALAARLLAGMLTFSSTALAPAGAAGLIRPPAAVTLPIRPSFDHLGVAPVAPLAPRLVAAPGPVWVVQRGDTLWRIAEVATGDPERVDEVLALNAGTLARPRDLRPGMRVVLPVGARVPADRQPGESSDPASVAAVNDLPAGTHVVVAGESMWTIAAERVAEADAVARPSNEEIAPYWEEVVEDNLQVRDPNLIYPGQALAVPALAGAPTRLVPRPAGAEAPRLQVPPPERPPVAGEAPTSALPSTTTPSSTLPMGAPGRSNTHVPSPPAEESHHDGTVPAWALPVAGLAGATALASWALVEARRRRDRQRRRAPAGSVPPPPDESAMATSAAVNNNADIDGVQRLDSALEHLAMSTAAKRLDVRPQVVLRRKDHTIDVFLAEPVDVDLPPWRAVGGGRVWTLGPTSDLADVEVLPEGGEIGPPCPALVQLGTCEGDAELYVDLEGLGTIAIRGDQEEVRQIARAVCATLAVAPAAELCRILTFGFDAYGLDAQVDGRLVVAESIEKLIAEVIGTARPVAATLEAEGVGSSFQLRAVAPDEGWQPAIVVLAGTQIDEKEAEQLREVAGTGGRGAAVVMSGTEARWSLELDAEPGSWVLMPLGIPVKPVKLAAEELLELGAYLADAAGAPVAEEDGDTETASSEPTAVGGHESDTDGAPTTRDSMATLDWSVMVRLLGRPDLVTPDGRTPTTERAAPLELLTWIVTHRDTATRVGAVSALWSGREMARSTINNTVSGARLLLRDLAGEPADGGEWIPANEDRLQLHDSVISDYDFILELRRQARRLPPATAINVLAQGLPLLRGVPFEGHPSLWADEEFVASTVAVAGATLAVELATLRLNAGDPGGALEATGAGLHVIAGHEELVRLSMLAWVAAGDRAAAVTVYTDYERAVSTRGESVSTAIAELRKAILTSATSVASNQGS